MATVDLELLKKHVRADDFADDDDYLAFLLDAAERHVCNATNREAEELIEMGCYIQLNAASVMGDYGMKTKLFC